MSPARPRGSSASRIAAESCERTCYAMELDPAYVDVAVQRWQAFTGEVAHLAQGDEAFDAVANERRVA